ncbi:MAG: NUDIX domain-containing protein [Patescibacteria group bacterium]
MTVKENKNLKVKKQVVAGFIIFRRTSEGIKFLMLYRRGSYWNFPKGHFELGENSFKVALRETEEETGLKRSDLRIIPGFRTKIHFTFEVGSERIHDRMILYLAETRNPRVTISPREHSGFAWFLYNDAVKTIGKKYMNTKRVLKQAHDFILFRKNVQSNKENTKR